MTISHMIIGAWPWRAKKARAIILGALGGLLPDIVYVCILSYTTIINLFSGASQMLSRLPDWVNTPGLWMHAIWIPALLLLISYFYPKIRPLGLGWGLHLVADWLTHNPINYALFWPYPWRLPGGLFPTMTYPYKPTIWWVFEIILALVLLISMVIKIRGKKFKILNS